MLKYRVVLHENNTAKPDQKLNGCLASNGVIQLYSRGEAIKKAKNFGGEIDVIELSKILGSVSMIQINENALLDRIVKELDGREQFRDTSDVNERIFDGSIFETIACEFAQMGTDSPLYPQGKVIEQLDELAQLIDSDYVMITMN